ncbi:MAG: transcriptional regulator [Bacteroidota bacterium]
MKLPSLDSFLHQELRLKIMSLLISVESAEFTFLLEQTGATKGNLSAQLSKLKDKEYIEIHKGFKGNYPLTTCKITSSGIKAFEAYVQAITQLLNQQHMPKDNGK